MFGASGLTPKPYTAYTINYTLTYPKLFCRVTRNSRFKDL